MSSLAAVVRATCRIVDADGRFAGTGFFVLPGGWLLTCDHVVRPLQEIRVVVEDGDEPLRANYMADRSVPDADLAVLQVPDAAVPPIQLGELRTGVDGYGIGFRPSELGTEPRGRLFPGNIAAGQYLRIGAPPLPPELVRRPPEELPAWSRGPVEYHAGQVANFSVPGGLEQGISGGPVYDGGLRRVVGLLRAIEGENQAFVLPLALLDAVWPDLRADNEAQVVDSALDALGDNYAIGLVREGARRHRPQPWRDFAPLFDLHRRFAGRAHEMERLERFLEDPERGYALVTGPSGYGKSALLSNYALRLRDAGHHVAIHMITSRVDNALTARAVLSSLCRQLLALHDLGGDLPADDGDLRHLFTDLLRFEPSGQDVLVVVDGLDEVLGLWRLENLFPVPLPRGMRVVLSARRVADLDWSDHLRLPPGQVETIELDRFSRQETAALLATVLSEDDPGFAEVVDRIGDITEGDPFYVRDVVDDLDRRDMPRPEDLDAYPVGHLQYLRAWWTDARERNPGQGFVDLMGTLAVVHAPLGEAELVRIAPDDALTGADLPVLIAGARRYVEGTDADGYRLAHRRIEEFVQQLLQDTIRVYRRRLTDFCVREPDVPTTARARRYALTYGLRHLLDEERVDDAYALLSPEWIARNFLETGSYRPLVDRFAELALHLGRSSEDPAQTARVPGLLLGRETARELIAGLPSHLLVAWTHLGGVEQVLTICAALSPHRAEAAEPLLAVAGALLDSASATRADAAEAADAAADVIGRAIGMLPYIRTHAWMLDRLDVLTPLLVHPALADPTRATLIEQLAAAATSMPTRDGRAMVLACAASAAAGAPPLRDRAATLLSEFEEAVALVERPADVSLLTALAFPARETLRPAESWDALEQSLRALAGSDLSSTIERDVLGRWLDAWGPGSDEASLQLLTVVAEGRVAGGGTPLSPRLVEALCEAGLGQLATDLLAPAVARGDESAVGVTLQAASSLARTGFPGARSLLGDALALAEPGQAARAHAALGDWAAAIELVREQSRAGGLVQYTVDALAGELGTAGEDPDAVIAVADGLLEAAGLEAADAAKVEAWVARRLARARPEAAEGWLRRAMRHALAELPEGDSDFLHLLVAVAHVDAAEYEAAARVAEQATWSHRRVRSYEAMIGAGRSRPDAPLEAWARRLGSQLDGWRSEDDTFISDAVASVIRAADALAESVPGAAAILCRAAEPWVVGARRRGLPLGGAVDLARVWWRIDVAEGHRLLGAASALATQATSSEVQGYLEALARADPIADVEIARWLRAAAERLPELDGTPPTELLSAWRAHTAYAASLARLSPEEALSEVRELVARLPALPFDSPPEDPGAGLMFRRLLADLVAGSVADLPDAVGAVAAALASVSAHLPAQAADVARDLLPVALDASTADVREHAVRAYFTALASEGAEVSGAGGWAVDLVQTALGAQATDRILEAAVDALVARGRHDDAAKVASRIRDGTAAARKREEVETDRHMRDLVPDSPLERAFFDGGENRPALAVIAYQQEAGADVALASLIESLLDEEFQQPRYRLLDEFLPLAVPPLLALAGTPGLDEMLTTVDEVDARFREAAAVITTA